MEQNGKPAGNTFSNYDSVRFIDIINLYVIVVVDNITCSSNRHGRQCEEEQLKIVDSFLADQKARGEILGKSNNHKITKACELQPGFYKVARDLQSMVSLKST